MLKNCIEKSEDPRGRSFASLVWLCNLELQTGRQFFKSSRHLYGYVISNFKQVDSFSSLRQFVRCQVIEIRNERVSVFAVICLVNIRFCLACLECLKVKCDVEFLKIHKECKTNIYIFTKQTLRGLRSLDEHC